MSLKLSKALFFFLFIFSPLAFGTTEPWSYAVMESITGLACLLFFIHILKNKQDLHQVPGITPLILFLFYILLGIIPLPPVVVHFLSPSAFKIHQTTNTLLDTQAWMTLSLHPKATLSEFFRYATYVMFYFLTVQLLKQKTMLKTTALVIAVFGGLLAFSSILQFYLTENMALWFRPSPINAMVVGPYVNHNHYAGLMEMIFPVTLGLFLFYRPRIKNTSIIKGIAEIFSQEKANIHILIGMAALLTIISIFVSLSRGAMISICFSLIVFAYFLLNRKISKGNTNLLIAIVIITALSIGWFGWDQIFDRFAKLKNAQGVIYESRLDFWQDTHGIISDFTLSGSGMGTFSDVYPLYRSFKSKLFLAHAHNDYLELLAEGGLISFFLAAFFLIAFFHKTFKVFKKRRDAFSIYLYIGCITAITSILLHSFTDFNMHIGANGLWFFFIAGLAVSAANTGLRQNKLDTRLPKITSFTKKITATLAVILFALFAIVYNFSNLVGIFYYSHINKYIISSKTPAVTLEKIDKIAGLASSFDPFVAGYIFTKANTAWFLNDNKTARAYFDKCIRLEPLNSEHLNRFAIFASRLGETQKADMAFAASTTYDKSNAKYAYEYGTWLLAQKRRESGLENLKKAMVLSDEYFDQAITAMIMSRVSKSDMENTIPELPGPTIEYANFLATTGRIQMAVPKYLSAMKMIEDLHNQGFRIDPARSNKMKSYFYKIFNFFRSHNDIKNAMLTMERAEKIYPMNAGIKVMLGDLYFQQGILYKALDKYDHALLLDPENKRALRMIKRINQ